MNCPKHGTPMQRLSQRIRDGWFRGEDTFIEKDLCPICAGWKTVCDKCGKVLKSREGVIRHKEVKHGEVKP